MIYISIGTTGNPGNGKGMCQYVEAAEQEFKTYQEAVAFLKPYMSMMDTRDWVTICEVLEQAGKGYEVDPEMEIRDPNGKYTNLIITLRGHQDPDWNHLRDELERACVYMDQCGSLRESEGKDFFLSQFSGAYACANAITHHQDVGEALRVAS